MAGVVAAHQPNFLPWLGFFDKVAQADTFVLLDDVQFPRTSAGVWTNRVRLLVGARPSWITVPVRRHGRGFQKIREVRIDESQPWRTRVLKTIDVNYRRAPGFEETFPIVREAVSSPASMLAEYNEHGLTLLLHALKLDTSKLVRSSTLAVEGSGSRLLAELTRAAGGTVYVSGDGAGDYLEPSDFEAAGIELRFQGFRHPVYPQRDGPFVPGLSIVDALLCCGLEGTRALIARIGADRTLG